MNKRKLDDSNAKRLESLKKQAEEFKQKKSQIRSDLSNPEAAKNKKIVFDENDEEYEEEKQKMINLLDDETEDDEESNTDDENDELEKETAKFDSIKTQAKVQIESNLKELFCSNDVFKFQFSNLDEKAAESLSSDDDDDEVNSDQDSLFESQLAAQKTNEKIAEPKGLKAVASKPNSVVSSFLPDFNADDQIKDALVYFCSTRTEEELREDWPAKRETLVQEYKKKHKRMIRIKKHKENEKLFSWKIKKTSSKQH